MPRRTRFALSATVATCSGVSMPLLFFARAQLCAENALPLLPAATNGNAERGITCHLECGGHCLHRASPPIARGSTSDRKPPVAPVNWPRFFGLAFRPTHEMAIYGTSPVIACTPIVPSVRDQIESRATIDRSPATSLFVSRVKRRTRSYDFQGKNFRSVAQIFFYCK